ncbi:MAG: guanylate kinase [Nitrospinales bacterium]
MKPKGIVFIISAPSGTGKTTVCNILQQKIPELKHSISHTTRPPRPTEKNGTDYYFVSKPEFKAMIDRGAFLEWAVYHDHYYGTSLETIDAISGDGGDILLELDVQGAETLLNRKFAGVFILLLPPSIEELGKRLRGRSTESEESIQNRIDTGKREIAKYLIYDYVITNRDPGETVNDIIAIIHAEKCRADRYRPTSPDIEILLNPKVKT